MSLFKDTVVGYLYTAKFEQFQMIDHRHHHFGYLKGS